MQAPSISGVPPSLKGAAWVKGLPLKGWHTMQLYLELQTRARVRMYVRVCARVYVTGSFSLARTSPHTRV